MLQFFKRLFGSKHERDTEALLPLVEEINEHFSSLAALTEEELKAKTAEFKSRISEQIAETSAEIEKLRTALKESTSFDEHEAMYTRLEELNKQVDAEIEDALNDILPEAFAVVKETCRRLLGQSWDVESFWPNAILTICPDHFGLAPGLKT